MKNGGLMTGLALVPALVGLVFLGGCKPAEDGGAEGGSGEAGPAVVAAGDPAAGDPEVVEEPKVPARPKWTPEDGGFARHLPADTDLYLGLRQLDVFWELFGEFSSEEAMERVDMEKMADVLGESVEDVEEWKGTAENELPKVFPAVFSEEVFLSARGLEWWLKPYVFYQQEVYPEVMAEMMSSLMSFTLDGGGPDDQADLVMEEMMAYLQAEILSQDELPSLAVQMGGRVSEGRAEVVDAIVEWLALAPEEEPQFVAVDLERDGVRWRGFRLDWERLWKQGLDAKKEELKELLGEEGWVRFEKLSGKMPFLVVCGEVGDYVVLSAGFGEEAMEFSKAPSESLAGTRAFEMLAQHEEESLFGTLWMSEELVSRTHTIGSSEPAWKGFAKGLEASEKLATGREMAQSLREIGKLSAEKRAGMAHDLVGAVVLKDGLHLELQGGWAGVALDLETPLQLAGAVSEWEDQPFLRAHWRKRAEYSEKTLRQWEEGMKLAQLIQQEVSSAMEEAFENLEELEEELGEDLGEDPDGAGEDPATRRELAEIMKRDFQKAMENLWSGYRDHLRQALGEEAALVVDLQGEAPPIVGFEEETLKRGRIPRLAYVREVKDRGELAVTWELWRDAGVRLLGLLAEVTETPIPFPDTMSADTNELRTHFMPMPFATDDFLPSISVSDELFIVGSSKALAARIDQSLREVETAKAGKAGVLMEIHMDPWWDFCEAWLDVASQQGSGEMPLEPGDDGDAEAPEPELGGDAGELGEDLADAETSTELEDLDPELEALIEEVEGDGFIAEDGLGFWDSLKEASPFELSEGADPETLVRGWIGQARRFRGASYRKWLDDGVPRSRMSFHWGEVPVEEE